MNAASKEIRLIFWTWIAVVAVTLLPVLGAKAHPLLNLASGIGFFVGVPLLAVLPIGSELEDGTLSLLLSQPITRVQLWLQKFAVSVIAVVTASLAFTVVWRGEVFPRFPTVLWVLVALCAGPYCALIARSVRGALALNIIGMTLVFIWLQLSLWLHVEMVVVLWALLMLALGVRKMTRLELTGGHVGVDLLTVGPRLRLFRSQPSGAVMNFIRKELGLLRPLWLITPAFICIWTILTIWYRLGPDAFPTLGLVNGMYLTLTILLAGSLSVGEEKLSGMHPWHLTLPMPSFHQWLLKLVIALLSSALCVSIPWGLNLIVGSSTPPFISMVRMAGLAALLTFAVFWSACFISGTVRAVLLGVMVSLVLLLANAVRASNGLPRVLVIAPTLAVALIQSYRMFRVQPPQTAMSFLRHFLPLAATAFLFSVLQTMVLNSNMR